VEECILATRQQMGFETPPNPARRRLTRSRYLMSFSASWAFLLVASAPDFSTTV